MQEFQSVEELQNYLKQQSNKKIGFIPTMGALHNGHLSLVELAKEKTDFTVVSIFINPTQFGKNEDLITYPKNIKKDLQELMKLGVDCVFIPNQNTIYPTPDHFTEITVPHYETLYCGITRPTFFKGICSVVLRLFNIIKPNEAFFGEKDFQQLFIIKKMVKDLFLPIKITSSPIIREKNGLAMSSRNAYLTNEEIKYAKEIFQYLSFIKRNFKNSPITYNMIITLFETHISNIKYLKLDYIDIVDSTSLKPSKSPKHGDRILTAVYCNKTRLIDNITL